MDIMRRFGHRSEEVIKRSTYEERIESMGVSLSNSLEHKAETILTDFKIDPSGLITGDSNVPSSVKNPVLPPVKEKSEVIDKIMEYNHGRNIATKVKHGKRTDNLEASSDCVCYVSVDDILVKSQKGSRNKTGKKNRKFVSNTVIHIQYKEYSYTLTTTSKEKAMKLLIAFLLYNHLLEDTRLIFFSDGATSIRDDIQKYFSFREYTLILDWFHLENKCSQFLSMGVKGGKEERQTIRKELAAILWAGNVEEAKSYIKGIHKKNIKNQKQLEELVAYLDRKSPYIACYAIRKEFGLRNSSNLVEKDNDRVVAMRQKKKGMSWSNLGSSALAVITAADICGELDNWIYKKDIVYKMAC